MGMLEVEFTPIIKKIMAQGPEKIEELIRHLVLIIEKQDAAMRYVKWSEEAKEYAQKSRDELVKAMISLKEQA